MRRQYEAMCMTVIGNSELIRESLDPSMTQGRGRPATVEAATGEDATSAVHAQLLHAAWQLVLAHF